MGRTRRSSRVKKGVASSSRVKLGVTIPGSRRKSGAVKAALDVLEIELGYSPSTKSRPMKTIGLSAGIVRSLSR